MKQTDILFVLISSFIVVASWIGFNLYHKWATSTISTDIQAQIIPIDPNFDEETVAAIKKRKKVVPVNQLKGSPVAASPTTTINPSIASEVIIPTQPESITDNDVPIQ